MAHPDPLLMEQRYGAPRRGRRRLGIALVAVLVLAGLAWLAWAAVFHSNPEIRAEVTAYEITGDREARADVSLRVRDDDVSGSCLLRAVADDKTIVGERNVTLEELREAEDGWVSVRTERRATTVTLERCTAD